MTFTRSIASLALSSSLLSTGWGNEALELLSQEADRSQNVYEEAASLAAPRKDLEVEEKNEPLDARLPDRWRTELEPKFPFQAGTETRVAPRGLFEYQHNERSQGRGTKLSRARVGVVVETIYGIEIQADALLSSSGKYEGWETLKASVPLGEWGLVHAGKFPPPFSTEYSRDAAIRWFPTLSPFNAQLAPASSLGTMIEAKGKVLDWKLGWFGSDANRSMPSLDGDGAVLVSVARTFNRAGKKGAPKANFQRVHFDYLYNSEGSQSQTIPQGYRHLASAGTQYSSGRVDLYSEILAARGPANTAYGVTAAGRFWLLQDAISFVGRYQYARSREPGGIISYWGIPATGSDATFPTAFPATTVGQQLNSFYGGFNFHFDDDNLIVGTGVEYRQLDETGVDSVDLRSWGWTTFVRYAF